MKSRATIRDVAERAGCSITAVSLILNNKEHKIPQATRDRVVKAAAELNYSPNQLAVGMLKKKTNVLGLITPNSSNMFFASIIKTVEQTAGAAGYAMILVNTGNMAEREHDALRMFVDRFVDGIIFFRSASHTEKWQQDALKRVQSAGVPLVMVDRLRKHSRFPRIMLDHQQGGYLAIKHLLSLGHRRIACMTGLRSVVACEALMDGYRKALNEEKIAFDERLIFEGDFSAGKEGPAMEQFLAHGATAIFCFNDLMTMGLYREIARRGLSIPDDISVVGYDDAPYSDLIHPPMTTVRQRVKDIGARATELLIDIIAGETGQEAYVFEPEMILRKSTGPVKMS